MHACDRFKKLPSEIMNLPPGERALILEYTNIALQKQPKGGVPNG